SQSSARRSSREAAVYALLDFGFRAIVAPSFGDIFASNAVNNGVLPAVVGAGLVADLISDLDDQAELAEVDLSTSRLTVCGREIPFDLDPVWREKLINGWDDIDLTHQHAEAIRTYRAKRAEAHPWIFAAAPGAK
ncbi:MAG: 3-isopropylmalate dehydratase small subunit, partial [Pseudomonadota bacterium]